MLDDEKASWRRTDKFQADANDKVWILNENTEKAESQLAKIYEEVGKETVEVDHEVKKTLDELKMGLTMR